MLPTATATQPRTTSSTKTRRAPTAIYTIGYQGHSLDEFVDLLIAARVKQLVDVRCNAVSRKRGFSGKGLKFACEQAGLKYLHMPELGVPSSYRGSLKSRQDYDALLSYYKKKLLPQATFFVRFAADLASERTSALMCFESDVTCCHRGPLAAAVSELAELPIRHL